MTTFGKYYYGAKGRLYFHGRQSLTNVLNAILSSLAIFVGHWGLLNATAYGFSRLLGQ